MRRSTLLRLTFLLGLVLIPAITLAGETPRGRLNTGPTIDGPVPPTIPPQFAGGCTTGQTNNLNGQAGIDGPEQFQSPCLPGSPEGIDDLIGFAFVLRGCMDGGIGDVALNFRIADIGDPFYLFIWRDLGGLPNDACGLAAYGAIHYVQVDDVLFSVYNICNAAVPIADGERFFVGVVYHRITELFGPDWFIGRNVTPGFPDRAYINLSGQHGDWMDLHNIGLGNRWGIIMNILTDCGPVSVEPSSWGAVKALWR